MTINDTPSSSNISRVAHNGSTLYIEFRSGKTYRYEDVSFDTWNQLVSAASVGKFFSERIRNAYKGVEVAQIPEA